MNLKNQFKIVLKLAENGNLIIFGIIPKNPATGYGYIKAENQLKKIT